jgi:hypothetical protein
MIRLGTIAVDRVQESEVVVVKIIPDRCDQVMVPEVKKSVYECNKDYAEPDEPVVAAIYTESLPADPREVTREGRHMLAMNSEARQYRFPITRLKPLDSS